ncbi:hypothetical protein BJ165DRAFT_1535025 [Panaeolus papilionaceus]|nr:hypothetical protein BJ165DRAFT_1535025 [Panaeolus papilionaceus]
MESEELRLEEVNWDKSDEVQLGDGHTEGKTTRYGTLGGQDLQQTSMTATLENWERHERRLGYIGRLGDDEMRLKVNPRRLATLGDLETTDYDADETKRNEDGTQMRNLRKALSRAGHQKMTKISTTVRFLTPEDNSDTQSTQDNGVALANRQTWSPESWEKVEDGLIGDAGDMHNGGEIGDVVGDGEDKMLDDAVLENSYDDVSHWPIPLLMINGVFAADILDSEITGLLLANSELLEDQRPKIRSAACFRDALPSSFPLIPADGFDDHSIPFQTKPNEFGVYRVYPCGKPSHTPDPFFTLGSIADSPTLISETASINKPNAPPNQPASKQMSMQTSIALTPVIPEMFPNPSVAMLMEWFYGGNSALASKSQVDMLIKNVLQHPDFRKEDLNGFRMDIGLKMIDDYALASSSRSVKDKWINNASVTLSVPCDGFQYKSEDLAPQLTVSGIQIRKLTEVIHSAFSEPGAETFHISGYYSYAAPVSPAGTPTLLHDEVFSSRAFLEEQEAVTKHARSQGCTLEVVIAALLLGSDATVLADFGTQQLWPIYLFFGNQSKYVRTLPSTHSAHHLAYIPKLPEDIQTWYLKTFGVYATKETLSHLRRELFHAVWLLLLDDDLREAYLNGMDVVFWDKVERRVFPRFFIYAMDYLEKILFACIKNLSMCLCPECLIPKSKVSGLGTVADERIRERFARKDDEETLSVILEARRLVYEEGKKFTSTAVKRVLGPKSLNATQNAFSIQLRDFGFEFHSIIAPDLMHEFELGVFKSFFTHLLRIVHSLEDGSIQTVNERFRNPPTFGRDTIRKFSYNVSAMVKLRACDWENILVCSIPAFNGILPAPHGSSVRRLLFELCTWHSLAKLRSHSDTTVKELEASTFRLGKAMRYFEQTTSKAFETKELPKEETA